MSTPFDCPTGRVVRNALLALLLVSLPGVAFATQRAILISGFDDDHFLADLSHVYVTLLEAGYTAENIQVLCQHGEAHDLDGVAGNDVDGKCETQADVDQAFTALAGVVQPGDLVFFFATGHGGCSVRGNNGYPNSYICAADKADKIWDYKVADDFKAIDDATGGGPCRKICLVVPCRSGGFVVSSSMEPKPSDEDLAGLDQVSAVTAVRYDEDSNFDGTTGYPMTYWWTSALRGQDWNNNPLNADADGDGFVSLAEAYTFAKDKYDDSSLTSGETPQKVSNGCWLDHFTAVNGVIVWNSLLTNNWLCCPYMGHPMWEQMNCAHLGLGIIGTAGGSPERMTTGTRLTATELQAVARLTNAGTAPSQPASMSYFYRAPTLGLGFYDTGWVPVGTRGVPPLPPGDSLTMSPVTFTVPDVNPYGEPYWTFATRIYEPSVPGGSGWLVDDHQVKMVNEWTLTGLPEEPREIHFQIVNPTADSAMVVLGVDPSGYPPEWFYQLSPPANDTLLFLPGEVRVATLTLQGATTSDAAGTLHVFETLLPDHGYGACADTVCGDSPCGGYIRMTGGCTVTLEVQPPTAVLATLVSAQADPDCVRLNWLCSGAAGQAVTVQRRTENSGWQALESVPVDGAGWISYEDRNVVAGGRYGYRLAVRAGAVENIQGETWIDVPRRFALALQGLRPNPTQRDIAVLFSLPDMAPATLELVDVSGRSLVRREVGSLGPGNHVLNLGRETPIPAGVYLVRLLHGSRLLLAKGTVLR